MNEYMIHLCGDDNKNQPCHDILIMAETAAQAELLALLKYPEYESCRLVIDDSLITIYKRED